MSETLEMRVISSARERRLRAPTVTVTPGSAGDVGYTCFLDMTMLKMAIPMPTAKITVPKTKT
jgi:hypothetical protein